MMDPTLDRSEIAFFDLETTIPSRSILEFGAILFCPKTLQELYSYSTLVQPPDPSLVSTLPARRNGINREAIISAPTFADIADTVFDILDGRIWAGHNILEFDSPIIKKAFKEIGRSAPEPKGMIDSLKLLSARFGRRASDMKMDSLANYFGLGRQTHRSLADIRMNLEVLKYCATVIFLESSFPDIFTVNSWVSPNATARSKGTGKVDNVLAVTTTDQPNPLDMSRLSDQMETQSLQPDDTMKEVTEPESHQMCSTASVSDGSSGYAGFMEPNEISIPSINAIHFPLFPGDQNQRIRLFHNDVILQLCCSRLKIRFGISQKFVYLDSRPRLSFVVDISQNLCMVLDACEVIVKKFIENTGSSSEWKDVVTKNNGFVTARLHIFRDVNKYRTEIYQKDAYGNIQKLTFDKFDAAKLDSLLKQGMFVDAFLSLDAYDYQQRAGIQLVVKKLIIYSE